MINVSAGVAKSTTADQQESVAEDYNTTSPYRHEGYDGKVAIQCGDGTNTISISIAGSSNVDTSTVYIKLSSQARPKPTCCKRIRDECEPRNSGEPVSKVPRKLISSVAEPDKSTMDINSFSQARPKPTCCKRIPAEGEPRNIGEPVSKAPGKLISSVAEPDKSTMDINSFSQARPKPTCCKRIFDEGVAEHDHTKHPDTSTTALTPTCSSQTSTSSGRDVKPQWWREIRLLTKLEQKAECAFVSLLYGCNSIHVVMAVMLGESLRNKTKYDMVMMHTCDVPESHVALCRTAGWQPMLVEELQVHHNVVAANRWGPQVFTKLRAISLIHYKKVMLIDTDTFVVRSLDNLFDFRTPAALRRHPHGKYKHGDVIRNTSMRKRPGMQVGGYNGGLMLFETDEVAFNTMERQLAEGNIKGIPFKSPDQDYLSSFFAKWYCFDVSYNYQLHQLGHCIRNRGFLCRRVLTRIRDIHMVHFSGRYKLSHGLTKLSNGFTDGFDASQFKHFVDCQLVDQYVGYLGGCTPQSPAADRLRAQIKDFTRHWSGVWWDVLMGLSSCRQQSISNILE